MRVNYFHTGNHGEEVIALDSVVSDGPWPGSRTRLIDAMNLGSYYFEVIDRETNQPIYSTVIDPSSRFVNPADRKPAGHVWSVIENGPASEKVDLLVIGEGYTESE